MQSTISDEPTAMILFSINFKYITVNGKSKEYEPVTKGRDLKWDTLP